MPITWKNVAAPDFRASNRLALIGQKQIQDAMTGFSDMLGARGERQDEARENVALQRLSSLGTVAEVDAEFENISSEMGSGGDQKALMAARDTHLSNLFERERITYDQSQRAGKEKLQELRIASEEFGVDTQEADRDLRLKDDAITRDINTLKAGALAYDQSKEGRAAADAAVKQTQKDKIALQKVKNWGKTSSGKGKASTLSQEYMETVSNNTGELTSVTKKKIGTLNSQYNNLSQGAREAVFRKHTDPDYFGFKGVDLQAIEDELDILVEEKAFKKFKATGE